VTGKHEEAQVRHAVNEALESMRALDMPTHTIALHEARLQNATNALSRCGELQYRWPATWVRIAPEAVKEWQNRSRSPIVVTESQKWVLIATVVIIAVLVFLFIGRILWQWGAA
jgi:hypothetical protein